MDQRIKDYADSIYHRTHTQSADTLNADRIAYLRQRAAQGSADFPWSGIDTQRVLRVYSDHIDRLIRARFESFRDAFEEAGQFPSEEDMSLVLNELKSVRETNVENANLAITSFVKTRGGIWQGAGPTDVLQALSAATARGHDRVLSDWKVWRDSVRLRRGGSAALQMEKSNDSSTVPLDPAVEAATGNDSSLRVFLCHSSADKAAVRDLYKFLKASGFDPWLDEEDLVAGQDWEYEIRKAVRESDVVLVCLSQNSINKSGFIQKELKYALDVADEQPEGVIFIIPLKSGDRRDVPPFSDKLAARGGDHSSRQPTVEEQPFQGRVSNEKRKQLRSAEGRCRRAKPAGDRAAPRLTNRRSPLDFLKILETWGQTERTPFFKLY